MANLSLYLIVVVAATCALRAAAAPQHHHRKKHAHAHAHKRSSEHEQLKIELTEVLDKAVCPIRQEIDDDPMRVPRRIKMLKCARTPNPVCEREDIRSLQACCGQTHDSFNTQCVEVMDNVLVSYRHDDGRHELALVPVSVGCTCMIRAARAGADDV